MNATPPGGPAGGRNGHDGRDEPDLTSGTDRTDPVSGADRAAGRPEPAAGGAAPDGGGPDPGRSADGPGPVSGAASSGTPRAERGGRASAAEEGVRFALGTLTVLPVRVEHWDRDAARRGMTWAPLAGLLIGAAAALAGLLALMSGMSTLPAAVVSVAVPAVLTRGLHLDGLADVADGLGSAKPAEGALHVMKRSDIGPFGVVTLVLVLLAQVAVVDELYAEAGWAQGALGVVLSAVTARCAISLAARSGVPAARSEGLGAVVAGTVPARSAALLAACLCVVAPALGALAYWGDALHGAVTCLLAVLIGLTAAELLLQHCRRRFGGVTGDVFGALAEAAATAALLAFALG